MFVLNAEEHLEETDTQKAENFAFDVLITYADITKPLTAPHIIAT
jgi:hypothetical protein